MDKLRKQEQHKIEKNVNEKYKQKIQNIKVESQLVRQKQNSPFTEMQSELEENTGFLLTISFVKGKVLPSPMGLLTDENL